MALKASLSPFPRGRSLLAIAAPAILLGLLLLAWPSPAAAPPAPDSPAAKQQALIRLLESKAPPAEKALACKQLTIYGSKAAVPALAPLLQDPELASWARIALEAIPDPAADAALRSALGKVQGQLLVGVINSIGVRRDGKAVSALVKRLKAPDAEVASAAAVALGRIGGSKAAKALLRAMATAPEPARGAAAEGAILCGEWFVAHGQPAEAVKLYDTVRAANVPQQKQLEAIRGAILARQAEGLPVLLQQLRSPDQAVLGIGLRVARELPGQSVTEALAAELKSCGEDRQSFLLLALADRNDASVMPAISAAVIGGSPQLRLTAIRILESQGDAANVAVLLRAAVDTDPAVAKAACNALTRLPGNDVDAELLRRLPAYQGKALQVLLGVADQRHLDAALPTAMRALRDPDPGIRAAAIQALGTLGDAGNVAELAELLQDPANPARAELKTAILAIISRTGTRSLPALLPLAHNGDSGVRMVALQLLGSAGGPDALSALQAAVSDQDADVQDEAVRTLSTWPNNWPEDSRIAQPLLVLAQSSTKPAHQVLALRGYLQYLQADTQLKDADKLARLEAALPLVKRPEEKRLAIATAGGIRSAGALALLMNYAQEPSVSGDACAAILKLVDPAPPGVSAEQRTQALEIVMKNCPSEETKQKAQKLLKAEK
jgi:HEAT repeat protein